MCKSIGTALLATIFLFSAGCAIKTGGKSTWTIFCGISTEQQSEEQASVSVESTVVDKIVDSLTDGEISDAE